MPSARIDERVVTTQKGTLPTPIPLEGCESRVTGVTRSPGSTEPPKFTALTLLAPKLATGPRTEGAREPGTGETARPQAAATEAPAAIEATTAARIGERCRAGAVGRTVGTGS